MATENVTVPQFNLIISKLLKSFFHVFMIYFSKVNLWDFSIFNNLHDYKTFRNILPLDIFKNNCVKKVLKYYRTRYTYVLKICTNFFLRGFCGIRK